MSNATAKPRTAIRQMLRLELSKRAFIFMRWWFGRVFFFFGFRFREAYPLCVTSAVADAF